MPRGTFLTILSLLLTWPLSLRGQEIRSELNRFTLLNDRALINRHLQGERYRQIFDLSLGISSEVKKFIGDIKDAAKNETNAAQRQLKTVEVLTKNLNTESFVGLHLALGLPLPAWKIYGYQWVPNLFADVNLSGSYSINNKVSATDPQALTYLKKQTKIGLHNKLQWGSGKYILLNIYQESQADSYASLSQSDIIANEGTVVGFDGLNKDQVTMAIDLRYIRHFNDYSYELGIDELHLMEMSSSKGTTKFGKSPLFHLLYRRKDNHRDRYILEPFFGIHYRTRYNIIQGLHCGLELQLQKRFPFKFRSQLNNQFISLAPSFETRWFEIRYNIDIPHANPQENFWVASIHNVNLTIPMP